MTPRYLSRFLIAHRESIDNASLLSDQLVVQFKPGITTDQVLMLFADLITYCRPTKAVYSERDRLMRLEFDAT